MHGWSLTSTKRMPSSSSAFSSAVAWAAATSRTSTKFAPSLLGTALP